MKRTLVSLLLVFALILGLCGTSFADEKVHLVFWDECPGSDQTPLFKELIAEFEAENPDIEVEYVGIPWDSAKEKYDTAIASKTTPDVASIHNTWLSNFVTKGALVSLEDKFNAWEDADQFSKGLLEAIRADASDGMLYTIPYTDNMPVLWIRKDLVEEKGLQLPVTWDDFFNLVQEMNDPDNGKYGFTIRGGAGGSGQILHGVVAYSGITSYFDEDMHCTINNDKAVEFLERYAALYGKCTAVSDITAGLGETVSAFDSGVAAAMFHNLGSYPDHLEVLTPDQFVGLPYPLSVDGARTYGGSMWCGYVMFNTTEHPEESWRFLQFMASKHGISRYNEVIGQLPTRSDVGEEDWVMKAQHIKAAMEYAAQPDAVSVSEPTYIPTYSSIPGNMLPLFQEMLAGSMTPREYLDAYAAAIEEAYQEMLQMNAQ